MPYTDPQGNILATPYEKSRGFKDVMYGGAGGGGAGGGEAAGDFGVGDTGFGFGDEFPREYTYGDFFQNTMPGLGPGNIYGNAPTGGGGAPAGGGGGGAPAGGGGQKGGGGGGGGPVEGGGRPTGNLVQGGKAGDPNSLLNQVIQQLLSGFLGQQGGGNVGAVQVPNFLDAAMANAFRARQRQGLTMANEAAATGGAGSRDLGYRQSLLDEALLNTTAQQGAEQAWRQFVANLQAQSINQKQPLNMLQLLTALMKLSGGGL